VLEAIGKHGFLREVKGLIDEEMPSLKKPEVFFGLFGLMKYPATTKVQLQNTSDNNKESAERLSAKEVPDAICDLLFEKYVAKKGLNRNGSQTKSFRDIEEICSSVFKNIVPSKLKFEFERYSIESIEFPKREHDKLSIPKVPQMNKPYMLFYQLKNENHTKNALFQRIHEASKIGPSTLYGTSGAGKTRGVLEFLSHNYGFYFVPKNLLV